jgi:hypothetical protein
MHRLVILGIRTLELLFLVGAVGSFVVILLTSIEDLREVFASDTPSEAAEQQAPARGNDDRGEGESLLVP